MSTKNTQKPVCSCEKALKADVKKLTSENSKLAKKLAAVEAKATKAATVAANKATKLADKLAKAQEAVKALKAQLKAKK